MSDTNLMEYLGYHTKPEYSADDRCFVGTVFGINDTIVFGGETVDELEQAFHEAVDGYLDMCKRRGKTPNREYSGQFNFRLGSELHQRIDRYAKRYGESINAVASRACEIFLDKAEAGNEIRDVTINYYSHEKVQTLIEPVPYNIISGKTHHGGVEWRKTNIS